MNISQWFNQGEQDRTWKKLAVCCQRLDLPWVDDQPPRPDQYAEMYAICVGSCPVLSRCASYAAETNNGYGVDGGFYAGVWIPWRNPTGGSTARSRRSRAWRGLRATLQSRQIAR